MITCSSILPAIPGNRFSGVKPEWAMPLHAQSPRSRNTTAHSPRFGMAASRLLKLADFNMLGSSTVLQNMWLYALCIGSRVFYARSSNERKETIRQDTFGWYNWFMGTPLVQTGLIAGLGLLPVIPQNTSDLMMHRLNPKGNLFQKVAWTLLNRGKRWLLTTDGQLEQRLGHVLPSIKDAVERQAMIKRFTMGKLLNTATWVLGILYTLLVLGIGLIWLNIYFTRKDVQSRIRQSASRSQAYPPQQAIRPRPAVRMTPKRPVQTFPAYSNYSKSPQRINYKANGFMN